MTARGQSLVLLVHGLLAMAIIVAVSVLLALHDLDAPTYSALVGTGLGLVGGSAGTLSLVGFQQPAPATVAQTTVEQSPVAPPPSNGGQTV